MHSILKKEMTILFQGDSITDCNRCSDAEAGMGFGYAGMVASRLAAQCCELELTILNRGISGNRLSDLVNRWDKECLDLKPGLVSILIGINNTWRKFDSNDPTSEESFYSDYHSLLSKTRKKIDATIVLCEPFVLPVPQDRKGWRVDLDPKINIVRELAREFKTLLVPFDSMFAAASIRRECKYWLPDGVHPSLAGHSLMADLWMKTVLGKCCC